MNLGLGNLASLRAYVLPPDQEEVTTFDDQLALIGQGVARGFERRCDRVFGRAVGDVCEFSGDRLQYVLPRYPLEAVTKIEQRARFNAAWCEVDQNDFLSDLNLAAGLLQFVCIPGDRLTKLRVTYTGGYWFDDSEDNSGEMPEGANPVPDELKLAWLTQCAFVWSRKDKLGVPLEKTVIDVLGQQPLHPQAAAALDGFKRMQLT